MFKLLKTAQQFLDKMDMEWCYCGGWAIDLFVGKESRPHKDLDIVIFDDQLEETITYMLEKGWAVEAPTRKGFVPVTGENCDAYSFDNLWCMNRAYPTDYIKVDEQSTYNFYHYDRAVQENMDFVEVQLNARENGDFVYRHNPAIRLELKKAFYTQEGLPFLAPEIVLLYKSKYLSADNQNDFDLVVPKMNDEQKVWLKEALILEYGNDHPWVVLLNMHT